MPLLSGRGTTNALLAAGADPNARDSAGHTPLHHAARFGHIATAALLLDRGAEVDPSGFPSQMVRSLESESSRAPQLRLA